MDSIIGALKDLGEKKWILYILMPAVTFVGALTLHYVSLTIGLGNVISWWGNQLADIKVLIIAGFLLTSFFVGVFLDLSTDSILHLFSGLEDSKAFIHWFFVPARSYYLKHFERENKKYQALALKESLSYDEQFEVAHIEEELHDFPVQETKIRSTKIGNILAAAVEYSEIRFGIDFRSTWLRMIYSISPETFRNALVEIKMRFDFLLRVFVLISIYTLFVAGIYTNSGAFWQGVPIIIATLLLLWAISKWCHSSAKEYSELVKSMYDLYRFDLYESLRIPLPKQSGDAEVKNGKQLSEHLWRGLGEIKYTDIKKSKPES